MALGADCRIAALAGAGRVLAVDVLMDQPTVRVLFVGGAPRQPDFGVELSGREDGKIEDVGNARHAQPHIRQDRNLRRAVAQVNF